MDALRALIVAGLLTQAVVGHPIESLCTGDGVPPIVSGAGFCIDDHYGLVSPSDPDDDAE